MKLLDVIKDLQLHEPEATIYVAEPWTINSEAIVAFEYESGGAPKEAINLSYFLEVFVARDFIYDYKSNINSLHDLTHQCERLIQYAINDA